MNNRKAITRKELESWGIIKLFYVNDSWHMRRQFIRKGKTYEVVKKETTMNKKYVYAPPEVRRVFTLSVNGQHKSIQLNRILYAWFIGDIPEGMEVKGDPENYRGLELISVKENNRLRWTYLRNCKNTEGMSSK